MSPATPRVEGPFVFYSEEFRAVLGDDPQLVELVTTDAHEGPVYVSPLDALFFTTVPRTVNVPLTGFKEVSIGRLDVSSGTLSTLREASGGQGLKGHQGHQGPENLSGFRPCFP
jgi:hypothetical protein